MKTTKPDFLCQPFELRKEINDSLFLKGGTCIASLQSQTLSVDIIAEESVRIIWDGVSYGVRDDFPDDLVEAIKDNTIYKSPRGAIQINNYFEYVVSDKDGEAIRSDFAELDLKTATDDDLRAYLEAILADSQN